MSLFKREDETTRFVLIRDPAVTAVWKASLYSCVYHATVNGLVSVCPARCNLSEEDPYPGEHDRSNCLMTCHLCAERVRRVKLPHAPETYARRLGK